MATKAELEAQIEELRRKLDLLEARLIISEQSKQTVVLPRPADVPWPRDYYPFGWPKIYCGSGSISASGTGPVQSFN